MPTVVECDKIPSEAVRVGEVRRLSSGTSRRYITCDGRSLLIQLPVCYTPSGFVSDFDEGGRITLIPTEDQGVKLLDKMAEFCTELAKTHSQDGKVVAEEVGQVTASTPRARDVRIFEAEDLSADDCVILQGDVLTCIISPEYIWTGTSGRAGVHIRVVQMLLHTDRGRYRNCMINGAPPAHHSTSRRPPPPPPPPPPGNANQKTPPPPPPPLQMKKKGQNNPHVFRPTVFDIVTAKNALRKVAKKVI